MYIFVGDFLQWAILTCIISRDFAKILIEHSPKNYERHVKVCKLVMYHDSSNKSNTYVTNRSEIFLPINITVKMTL